MPICLRAVVIVLMLGAVADATDSKAIARAAYQEGTKLFEVGEYQSALAAFKRAYLAYDEPAFLFNIGQCHRLLGDKAEAVRSYRQYLRKVPDSPNRGELEKIVADLEEALEKERAAAEPASAQPAAVSSPVPAPASPAPARPADKPLYKKWWLWTIVGGVVVAGVAVGLGVGLTSAAASDNPTTLPDFGPRASSLRGAF